MLSPRNKKLSPAKSVMSKSSFGAILLTTLMLNCLLPAFAGSKLVQQSYRQLPGWNQGEQLHAWGAWQRSCRYDLDNRRMPSNWRRTCERIVSQTPRSNAQARQLFERYLTPYLMTDNGDSTGLFTGYYEPSIPGSLTPTAYYRVPLYDKPYNLVRVRIGGRLRYRLKTHGRYVMPPSRQTISDGPVLKNTPIIAWIHDKIDRFFLQIQGSGSVQLAHGKRILLGYNGQNGYKYYPIGAYLVNKGYLTKQNVSMQSIQAWLKSNPNQAERVMNLNPSFVFFRKLDTDSPIGAQGVPLTAGYSLAVDRRYTRYGTPVWLSTYLPKKSGKRIVHGSAMNRLMVAQDTGGAIKGPVRGDVFWGPGSRAEWLAGHMQSDGKMWVLLPR